MGYLTGDFCDVPDHMQRNFFLKRKQEVKDKRKAYIEKQEESCSDVCFICCGIHFPCVAAGSDSSCLSGQFWKTV